MKMAEHHTIHAVSVRSLRSEPFVTANIIIAKYVPQSALVAAKPATVRRRALHPARRLQTTSTQEPSSVIKHINFLRRKYVYDVDREKQKTSYLAILTASREVDLGSSLVLPRCGPVLGRMVRSNSLHSLQTQDLESIRNLLSSSRAT